MLLCALVGKNTFERFEMERQLAGQPPRIVRAPELAPHKLPGLLLSDTLFGPPRPLVLRDSDEATALQPLLMKLLDGSRPRGIILSKYMFNNQSPFAKELLKQRTDVQQLPSGGVILSQNTLDNRTAFAKWLKQHTDVQQFPLYNEKTRRTLLDTMQQWAQQRGVQVMRAALSELAVRLQDDQWAIANELERLQVEGDITEELVRQQLPLPPSSNAFSLLDMAASGQVKQLHQRLEELGRSPLVNPYQTLGLLSSQLMTALAAGALGAPAESEIARDFGLPAFAVRRSAALGRRLYAGATTERQQREHAHKLVQALAEADHAMKRSVDPWLALQQALMCIVQITQA